MEREISPDNVLNSIRDLIWSISPDGSITYINSASTALTGYRPAEIVGHNIREFVSERDINGCLSELSRLFSQSINSIIRFPYQAKMKEKCGTSNEFKTFEATVWPVLENGEVTSAVGLSHCISYSRNLERLRKRANKLQTRLDVDELTGAKTRAFLFRKLGGALERGRKGVPALICYIDLNNLKTVNNTHGHQAGDLLLTEVANVFSGFAADSTEFISRVGGDEFVFVTRAAHENDAADLLQRIYKKASENPISYNGVSIPVLFSTGAVLVLPGSGYSCDEVLNIADELMYSSKEKSRDGLARIAKLSRRNI